MLATCKSSVAKRPSGFSPLEVLVVCLIVSALVAAAAPRYLGYAKRAKTAEAKAVARVLWTAVRGDAARACGTAVPLSLAYPKAGLSSAGTTTPARWRVSAGGGNSITVDCNTGAITPDGDIFTITGTATDVASLQVTLSYVAAGAPPSQLKCSVDSGAKFVDC